MNAKDDSDDLAHDLESFDAPQAFREALLSEPDEEIFEILPENWDAWQLFQRLETQWRFSLSGPTGLDHNVAMGLMDRQRIEYPRQDELLAQLVLIERGALQQMRRSSSE